MNQTRGPAAPREPAASTDGVSVVTAEQVVVLGQALYDLARGSENLDGDLPARPWLQKVSKFLVRFANTAGQILVLAGRVAMQRPDNWRSGSDLAEYLVLVKDGFPVLWVPPADVLDALVRAPDRPARQQLLLVHRDEVLADARLVLSRVTARDLRADRSAVEQALDCVVNQPIPAQLTALTFAVNRAQVEVGARSLANLAVKAEAAADHGLAVDVEDVRQVLMLTAVAPSLWRFYPKRDDPVPSRPNRHASAHSNSEVQYTPGNALESVLLAVSVLRQAQASRDVAEQAPPVTTSTHRAGRDTDRLVIGLETRR